MPVQYLNIYLIGFLGSVVAVIVGIGFSYSGMSELGFSVYRGMEMTTYYLDKNRYDLYMNAMVYWKGFPFPWEELRFPREEFQWPECHRELRTSVFEPVVHLE